MSRIDRTCLMQGYESWDPGNSFSELTLHRHLLYRDHHRHYHFHRPYNCLGESRKKIRLFLTRDLFLESPENFSKPGVLKR